MKNLDMFLKEGACCGRRHSYMYSYQADYDREELKYLLATVAYPKILSYIGFELLGYSDESSIGNDSLRWLYEMKYKETDTKNDIRECLLKCSIEDKEWTKVRNEGYTGIFYRKITFLPDIQEMLKQKYQEYINSLNIIIDDLIREENKRAEERDERFSEWSRIREYKRIMPFGGENGRDGYIDADYKNLNGVQIRMVTRDVFDFGVYSYPKRLEGTKDALNRNTMTEDEKSLVKWLSEFGEFHHIRM